MSEYDSTGENPLRMSVGAFRRRLDAGEPAVVLDLRGSADWDSIEVKIPGAPRPSPEFSIDANWPRDRLIVAY